MGPRGTPQKSIFWSQKWYFPEFPVSGLCTGSGGLQGEERSSRSYFYRCGDFSDKFRFSHLRPQDNFSLQMRGARGGFLCSSRWKLEIGGCQSVLGGNLSPEKKKKLAPPPPAVYAWNRYTVANWHSERAAMHFFAPNLVIFGIFAL